MKRLVHTALLAAGFVTWLLGTALYAITAELAVLGDKLISTNERGNCWTHAFVRYKQRGGYLAIRPADGVSFLKRWTIPHVMWIKALSPGLEVEHFMPNKRSKAQWMPWAVVWYEGHIRRRERARPGDEQPATNPAPLE